MQLIVLYRVQSWLLVSLLMGPLGSGPHSEPIRHGCEVVQPAPHGTYYVMVYAILAQVLHTWFMRYLEFLP